MHFVPAFSLLPPPGTCPHAPRPTRPFILGFACRVMRLPTCPTPWCVFEDKDACSVFRVVKQDKLGEEHKWVAATVGQLREELVSRREVRKGLLGV
jgi:hypothetical protein